MKKNRIKVLSIIIPAYKAEAIISKTLLKVREVLRSTRYNYEIICVVDGNIDKTFETAESLTKKYPDIKVFGYQNNLGKGHAVRFGMAKAKGEIIGFIDAGLDINPNGISMLL